jgi:hypothetical protein
MRMEWKRVWAVGVCVVLVGGVAMAGAPPTPSLAGPTRGGLNLVVPYYPVSARAGGLGTSTTALEGVDSQNPAALGFFKGIDLSLSYGRGRFDDGPDPDIYNGHVVLPVPVIGGSLKIIAFKLDTRNEDVSLMGGLETEVSGNEFGVHYGREIPLPDKMPGRLAIGVGGYPYDPSKIELSIPDGPRVAKGRGQSQVGSVRAGAIYQVTLENIGKVSLGGEFTHIKDELKAWYTGMPGRLKDNYYVNIWTLGFAYHLPNEKTIVLGQYTFGRAQGDDVRANYSIYSLGLEHEVLDRFALRVGMHDTEFTCGAGVKLPHDFRVDYAYMANYGQQVRDAFGTGPLHIITVGKTF